MKTVYSKNTTYSVNNLIYQNFHKHSIYTNPIIVDSCAYPEDYAKRAAELGHGIISSVEHGYQGRYIESFEMAEKYNLKYLFGVEAYFVYNRFEKDNTNAHICLLAKNENGRKAINRILSEAAETGFYYRSRVDYELIMSLPEDDVWISTACLAGLWRYDGKNDKSESLNVEYKNHLEFPEPYEWLIYEFSNKFKDNFYLEVQSHNVDRQKDLNKKIVEISNKYNIEIIAGVDSHFILPQDEWKRDYLQRSTSGIVYDDEDGFYMDYPSGQTLFNRFKTQGILSDEDIMIALDNTNKFLEVEKYTSVIFNKDMKMPSAPKYEKMTKAEKQRELVGICHHRWEEIKKEIPVEQHQHYLNEIVKELDIIFKIDHEDYFLLNYELIKEATTNRGGMITFSGRGCLIGNSLVSTIEGNIPLKDIKVGNYVLSEDGRYHRVLNTMEYDVDEDLITIKHQNGKTTLTSDHKIKIFKNGFDSWEEASSIKKGDYICTAHFDFRGIETVVEVSDIIRYREKTKVYDITVKDMHSYVADGIVVHNSGPSFYVNHLLGFTQIDRISSPITLYPERFLSTSRMSAGSLADIDFNCGNTKIFEDTQRDILGEGHAYPMIAYGTMKPKSAWKMYCRAVDVDFEISNAISAKIDEYETDLKYWDEESGEEEPNVYDYIPDDLREAFDGSKEFLGLTTQASRHPCFVGDTLVNTNKGYMFIKDINVGDKVMSHDGQYHTVLETMVHMSDDIYELETSRGEKIYGTGNHPFAVKGIHEECKWKNMSDLNNEDFLLLISQDKEYIFDAVISVKKSDITELVYNLSVNETNTYNVYDYIVHNCGNILLTQNIKEEVGIVRLKSKGGRETICACLDGKWCESYLMLKNDLLTVACVKLAYLLYERVGIPYMSLNGLLAEVKAHPEVWNMYEKGYVIGLNQVEKPSTQRKVMKYKPKNISELSAFIAGIRPAFKSLLDKLINREHFEYGIPTLDKLLQTEELPESFILYQEQIMKILSFAGIPMGDCYTVIKSISKKRFEKIMHYKEQFMTGMEHKLIEEEGISKERAEETAKTIWGIIEDASAYGFNSSHSLSVSFDSLLAAYFKALYPYEFYEVYLNLQMERADKAKALLAKKEMKEAFDISVLPMRFRQDNRKFVALPEQKALSNCLKSIKGFGDRIGEEFYKIKDTHYEDFIDFLVDIDIMKKNKEDSENYNPDIPSGFAVNGSQIETLIMLNYFEEFGKNYKLLKLFKLYNDFSSRKQINKKDINMETGVLKSGKDTYYLDITVFKKYIGKETKSMYKDLDMIGYVKEMASKVPDKSVDLLEQLKFERELLEFPIYQNPSLPKGWYYVIGFKTYGDKINTPYLVLYDLITSDLVVCSINKSKLFRDNPFGFYSIIHVKSFQDVVKKKKVGEKKFVPTNETKKVIVDYEVILRNEKEELEVLEQQMEEQKNKKEG